MIDWKDCPLVVSRPGYVSGAPALRDDPRVPASTIVDNMDYAEAATETEAAAEVIENFRLRTSLKDVLSIYRYAQQHRMQPAK